MKKTLLVAFVLVMSACMLFAQGGSEAAASKDVSLRMMWWGGDSRHVPTYAALEKYHELNSNVTVEGEPTAWDGYYQKLVTQLAGGTAADLLQIDQPWLNELASKGDVFVELTKDNINLDEFDANFLKGMCTVNGKIYGVPTGTNVNTMIVNVDMLKEAGVDPNTVWTWENMVTIGKQVHDYNNAWYLNGATPDHIRFWFEMYMAQLCGGVVDANGKVMFTEAEATKAFEYFQQWFDNGVVAPFAQTSLFYQKFAEKPNWVNGNEVLAWTWTSSMMKDIASREGFETRQLPVMAGAKDSGVLLRPSQIYCVPAASQNVNEALKLLAYMAYDPTAAEILGTARGVPSSTTSLDVATKSGAITEMMSKATKEGVAQAGLPQSSYQTNSEVMQAMQDVIDEFGYGKLTPAEAGKKMVAHLNETIKSL